MYKKGILELVKSQKTITPLGLITKVEVNKERFQIEVSGVDSKCNVFLCSVQIFRLPDDFLNTKNSANNNNNNNNMNPLSPEFNNNNSFTNNTNNIKKISNIENIFNSPNFSYQSSPSISTSYAYLQQQQQLQQQQEQNLVEFLRGQMDIFKFKRFYNWIRSELNTLVKKDYTCNSFDHSFLL
jgi:hypothetical protein